MASEINLTIPTFDSESFCGYKQITTFFVDFGIADKFGTDAIKDTYKRAFAQWKSDYKYLTELVMVLNWKSWEWAQKNPEISQVYVDLFYKARWYAVSHLKGKELKYFWKTTD